jgi:hypothetical protein
MAPTLTAGDLIGYVPIDRADIRCGDVLIFVPPAQSEPVAHRVAALHESDIRTKGDNSDSVDSWVIPYENITGRVSYAIRSNAVRRIHGGVRGRIRSTIFRVQRVVRRVVTTCLRVPYRRLSENLPYGNRLQSYLSVKVAAFERSEGTEYQLFMGRRLIGLRKPGWDRWRIYPPYRLIVPESRLPHADPKCQSFNAVEVTEELDVP